MSESRSVRKKKLVIVTNSANAPGATELLRCALQCDVRAKLSVFGSDDVLSDITQSDLQIYRVGPASFYFYQKIVEMLDDDKALLLRNILTAFDKISSYNALNGSGVEMPISRVVTQQDILLPNAVALPCVLKVPRGNRGDGVALVHNETEYAVCTSDFFKTDDKLLCQEYIPEARGLDKRLIVVCGKVVAAMCRRSNGVDFRANLHKGGSAIPYDPTEEERLIAARAVSVLGVNVGGVDIIDSDRGPLVLEVNPSPGFAIGKICNVDVAGIIVETILKESLGND